MKIHGAASISDVLGALIVYRNLIPMDSRLRDSSPGPMGEGRAQERIPRKFEQAYAETIADLLRRARALDLPDHSITRILYIGDTRLSDGRAFSNLCLAGGWRGLGIICDERAEAPKLQIKEHGDQTLCFSNRWGMLPEIEAVARDRDFPLDEGTAVVVDLDKTMLGARGRNDHVIDRVRLEAASGMASKLIGSSFEPRRFDAAYHMLNKPRFHSLTEDNQDYLAFACLILESGILDLETLIEAFESGSTQTFVDLLMHVRKRRSQLPAELRAVEKSVYAAYMRGDPTPFKAFRRMEYVLTADRMTKLQNTEGVRDLLENRIVLTAEVLALARGLRSKGALLFGLSDKPDEASLPTPERAAEGYRAIHQIEAHVVGGE